MSRLCYTVCNRLNIFPASIYSFCLVFVVDALNKGIIPKLVQMCSDYDMYFPPRDSTDFETQLYLCNEAFKVPTLTPFNSIRIANF